MVLMKLRLLCILILEISLSNMYQGFVHWWGAWIMGIGPLWEHCSSQSAERLWTCPLEQLPLVQHLLWSQRTRPSRGPSQGQAQGQQHWERQRNRPQSCGGGHESASQPPWSALQAPLWCCTACGHPEEEPGAGKEATITAQVPACQPGVRSSCSCSSRSQAALPLW